MAFLFLTNTVGASATAITGTMQTGYDETNMIAGPRSRMVRAGPGTAFTAGYTCASQAVTHCVITNADLFAEGQNATQVKVQYGGGPTVDSTTTVGNMTLVGKYSQDWVKTIAQTSTSFTARFEHGSSSDTMFGKLFFSNAFDFGTPPQLAGLAESRERIRPLLGHRKYAVEATLSLQWSHLAQATLEDFKALPIQIPFFIYDESGDLFDHKLEHVMIADPWTESRRVDGSYSLSLAVRRLAHYEGN